ncbi:hypothetical protein LCGC14_1896930, partial [marine sediment metagenome]
KEVIKYCPHCKRNVLATREDFRVGLAIVLAIFTGIGLLIYLAIYLDKEKIFCIHCKSECQIRQTEDRINTNFTYPSSNYAVVNQAPQKQLVVLPIEKETAEVNGKYCYNCGVTLSEREGQKFCPLCGSNIE